MQSHGIVYDAIDDRLICLYTVYRWDYSQATGRGVAASAPVIKAQLAAGEDSQRQYIVTSEDGGETWSDPRDITAMMPEPGFNGHFGSSGSCLLKQVKNEAKVVTPILRWVHFLAFAMSSCWQQKKGSPQRRGGHRD